MTIRDPERIMKGSERVREIAVFLRNSLHAKTMRDTGEIYTYDAERGIYRDCSEPTIRALADAAYGGDATTHRVNEVVDMIRRMTYTDRSDFQANPCLLSLANGVLDVQSGRFQPHSPEVLLLRRIPVSYHPNADCPAIRQFLSEVLASPHDVGVVQQMFGYMLVNHYRYHKAFVLVGIGRNGKTTLLNLIIRFLGVDNTTSITLQDVCSDKFAASELYGRMANVCDDLPSSVVKEAGALKMVTGESVVAAQRKFKDRFQFQNHAKMIFACNQIPSAESADDAYFSRWVILPFPNRFVRGRNADPDLLVKLATESELSGLLNFAVEGYRTLDHNRGFDVDENVAVVKRRYYAYSGDDVCRFMVEATEHNADASVQKVELYAGYVNWCDARGIVARSLESFFIALRKMFDIRDFRVGVGDRSRMVLGVKLRDMVAVKREIPKSYPILLNPREFSDDD